MEPEEMRAFQDLAAAFARRTIQPLLDHDSPDGDLSRVEEVLAEGFRAGLLASPQTEAPGYETGIWGRHALEQGPRLSLLLLEELAVVCPGVAMNFHVLGLGSLLLGMSLNPPPEPPGRVVVALMENGFPPGVAVLAEPTRYAPAKVMTVAKAETNGFRLRGRKDFVFAAAETQAFLVFARRDQEWTAFLVPAQSEGLLMEDAGFRMGLRACPQLHLTFSDVRLSSTSRLDFARPVAEVVMEYLRLNWLGLLALGTGTARGALQAARQYARERYQCWTEIVNHPGMRGLLAESSARVMLGQALLDRASAENGSSPKALLAAAEAKLMGLSAAAQAVTDSLQVFGGYGYMEDYRMEKRYRDINTLKHVAGGPRDLKALIADLSLED